VPQGRPRLDGRQAVSGQPSARGRSGACGPAPPRWPQLRQHTGLSGADSHRQQGAWSDPGRIRTCDTRLGVRPRRSLLLDSRSRLALVVSLNTGLIPSRLTPLTSAVRCQVGRCTRLRGPVDSWKSAQLMAHRTGFQTLRARRRSTAAQVLQRRTAAEVPQPWGAKLKDRRTCTADRRRRPWPRR
jgi:hypothetical protein